MRSNFSFRRLIIRKIAIAVSLTSVTVMLPGASAGASTETLYGCGTVGPYTVCGNPTYVTSQLVNYVMYLSAGIVTKDTAIQQQNSAPGYQTALNQLNANVYLPNLTQQTYLNLFATLAGLFRNAGIDLPYTFAQEDTAWYNPTSTNPNTIWAELPANIAVNCQDYLFELAAA